MATLYDFFNSYSEEERKKIKVEYLRNTEDSEPLTTEVARFLSTI